MIPLARMPPMLWSGRGWVRECFCLVERFVGWEGNSGGLSPMGLRLLLLKEASNPSLCIWWASYQSCGSALSPATGLFLVPKACHGPSRALNWKGGRGMSARRTQDTIDGITLDLRCFQLTGSTSQVTERGKTCFPPTCLVSSVCSHFPEYQVKKCEQVLCSSMLAALYGLRKPLEAGGEGSTHAKYFPLLGPWNKPRVLSASLEGFCFFVLFCFFPHP